MHQTFNLLFEDQPSNNVNNFKIKQEKDKI